MTVDRVTGLLAKTSCSFALGTSRATTTIESRVAVGRLLAGVHGLSLADPDKGTYGLIRLFLENN